MENFARRLVPSAIASAAIAISVTLRIVIGLTAPTFRGGAPAVPADIFRVLAGHSLFSQALSGTGAVPGLAILEQLQPRA